VLRLRAMVKHLSVWVTVLLHSCNTIYLERREDGKRKLYYGNEKSVVKGSLDYRFSMTLKFPFVSQRRRDDTNGNFRGQDPCHK